jgi:hypothetical protein
MKIFGIGFVIVSLFPNGIFGIHCVCSCWLWVGLEFYPRILCWACEEVFCRVFC